MCKDDCEEYKKKNKMDNYHKICKYFTGNKENSKQISDCRKYCVYYNNLKFNEELEDWD